MPLHKRLIIRVYSFFNYGITLKFYRIDKHIFPKNLKFFLSLNGNSLIIFFNEIWLKNDLSEWGRNELRLWIRAFQFGFKRHELNFLEFFFLMFVWIELKTFYNYYLIDYLLLLILSITLLLLFITLVLISYLIFTNYFIFILRFLIFIWLKNSNFPFIEWLMK